MIKYKQIQRWELDTEDIVCDSCGGSCHNGENFEFLTLSNSWGYGSKYDFETWQAQMCEKCVDEKLGFVNFKKDQTRTM